MAIELNVPVVVSATQETTYDKVWLSFFQASGTPTGGVRIIAEISPARDINGVLELAPREKTIKVHVNDWFSTATAEEYATMYALINQLLARANPVAAPEVVPPTE